MGISGEAGEVTDYLKKVVFHKHELNKEKLAEELGDVLWYLACTVELIGYDLEKIAEMNIEKLKKRYPEGWDVERSKNR
jgi:NTP pyrophosphatase (non-canonical NTP hydrolase)